jgi:anti-sigma B factor antagonist
MSSEPAGDLEERRIDDGPLTIHTGTLTESCMLRLEGELDLSNANTLSGELARVATGPVSTIVLDLGGLTFVDSTGISCLVQAARSYRDRPRLRILRPSGEVGRVLALTGVDRVLPYAD